MNKYKIVSNQLCVYTVRKDARSYSKSQTHPNHPYHKLQNAQKKRPLHTVYIYETHCHRMP